MHPKRFDKRYLPMLFIGLALWLGAMLVLYVMEKFGNTTDGQETLIAICKWGYQWAPVFLVLLLCFLQPILEEVSFRLWGVGKLWMAIVSITLMTLFAVSEMELWGLLFVAASIVVLVLIKDPFRRNWFLTIITSLCFALCHISGFGHFSVGSLIGLIYIFGMALVCCWLTINLSFWFSCLLHVVNNSLSILIPLFAIPSTYNGEHAMNAQESYKTSLCRVEAFAGRLEKESSTDCSSLLNISRGDTIAYTTYTIVGEPAEIAAFLALRVSHDITDTFFDWKPQSQSLEERVRYTIEFAAPVEYDPQAVFDNYMSDVSRYNEEANTEPLLMDTVETTLLGIYLVYSDTTLNIIDAKEMDYYYAYERVTSPLYGDGNLIVWSYPPEEDTTGRVLHPFCIKKSNPMADIGKPSSRTLDKLYGFSVQYRPLRQVTFITIR